METKQKIEALMCYNEQRKHEIEKLHKAGQLTAQVWNERRRAIALNQKRLNDRLLDIDIERWRKMRDNEERQIMLF